MGAKKRNTNQTANTKTTTKPKSLQTNNVSAANNTPKRKPKRKSTQIVEQKKYDIQWNKNLQKLKEYPKKKKHTNVPRNEDKQLCRWVENQRQRYKRGKVSDWRIERLTSIGFVWDVCGKEWDDKYQQLLVYKQANNHTFPYSGRIYSTLGKWVGDQRALYHNKKILKSREDQLNLIGFDWNPTNKK